MRDQRFTPERHVSVYGSHEGKSKRWELSGSEEELKEVLPLAVKHPPNQCFPRFVKNSFPNVVLGDFDDDILKIDFDERYYYEVYRLCMILVKKYPVLDNGFIILQSSTKTHKIKKIGNSLPDVSNDVVYSYKLRSFHAVFNGVVSKDEINSILAWLCEKVKDWNLIKWFHMQLIKGTYTLRIGFKGKKRPPIIVKRYGNQDKQIRKFLENRNFILEFLE